MSTRRLVIVVATVFAVVLAATLLVTRDDEPAPLPSPSPPTATVVPTGSPTSSPATSVPASPSPSPSTIDAASFTAGGDPVAGWFWLRDAAHTATASWVFSELPGSGDLSFAVEVLATDAVDGPRGVEAAFFLAWGPAAPDPAGDWYGRLPVTLPNVSTPDDPVGYTCRGTVTIPRSTIGDATALTLQIGRDDVRDELAPVDTHVAVNAASVKLVAL